ncbi:MAG TPA: hypothetical protein VIK40_10890 [Geomonas sp.]
MLAAAAVAMHDNRIAAIEKAKSREPFTLHHSPVLPIPEKVKNINKLGWKS